MLTCNVGYMLTRDLSSNSSIEAHISATECMIFCSIRFRPMPKLRRMLSAMRRWSRQLSPSFDMMPPPPGMFEKRVVGGRKMRPMKCSPKP